MSRKLLLILILGSIVLGCNRVANQAVPPTPEGFNPESLAEGKGDFITDLFTQAQSKGLTLDTPARGATSSEAQFHGYTIALKRGATVRFSVHGDYYGYLGIYRRDESGNWGKALDWTWIKKAADVYTATKSFEAYKDAEYFIVVGSPWRSEFGYELTASCQSGECQPAVTVCTWGQVNPFGQSSGDLASKVIVSSRIAKSGGDEARVIDRAQIAAALKQLGFAKGDEAFETLFEFSDDAEFLLYQLKVDGKYYDWVKWYAGDTEVGVIFEAASTRIVGEIGDGEIKSCTPPPATYTQASCNYGSTLFPESSADFEPSVTAEKWVTVYKEKDERDQLSALQTGQLRTALAQLHEINELPSLEYVFDSADEGQIGVITLEISGVSYAWVKFWAGDTEVGVIFEQGSTRVLATVGDQDVSQCM